MVQIDYTLKEEFSWEEYCRKSILEATWKDVLREESSREFMEKLNLPTIHPHCDGVLNGSAIATDSPLMGPLTVHDYHDTFFDKILTFWKQASPALLAMSELWLRLFAAVIAPASIAFLLWIAMKSFSSLESRSSTKTKSKALGERKQSSGITIVIVSALSLASSLVLTTDMWYVYQFGSDYGFSLLLASTLLSAICAVRLKLNFNIGICLSITWVLVFQLCYIKSPVASSYNGYDDNTNNLGPSFFQFGGVDSLPRSISEGLYYDKSNPFISKLVSTWPAEKYTYTSKTKATPWLVTGDTRTGIPFLVNFWHDLVLQKVWVPVEDDEAVRLEISFPSTGHDFSKPLYVILHGLSGGSQEEYIKDLVHRVNAEGSTAAIMIARGLMDTPILGWNVFHGARTSDIATTAKAIRNALLSKSEQKIIGVGYSMGAIIISNYVARSGTSCAFDAAISISGVIDAIPQLYNHRAKRLWQPMLALSLRDQFVVGKVAEKYRARLTRDQMREMMRATDISYFDEYAVVSYNGYRDIEHYYADMSAMGDWDGSNPGRIANVSIPLLVVHALDDPLITWKTIIDDDVESLRHPTNLVKIGSGNIMLLLTKGGGHVGWPLGMNPSVRKWEWMSTVVKSFADTFVISENDGK